MHQITLFQDKKSNKFLGTGHSLLPRPHPQWGGEHPLPTPYPLGASMLAPSALATRSAPCLRLKDDLCFGLLLGPARAQAFCILNSIPDSSGLGVRIILKVSADNLVNR